MSDRGHFLNIDTLNRILFSQVTRFGKLSFFNFRPSFLSPDAFRSVGCIGCKLIFLADDWYKVKRIMGMLHGPPRRLLWSPGGLPQRLKA